MKKYERNRIFHPCRVMFDFYRQALLTGFIIVENERRIQIFPTFLLFNFSVLTEEQLDQVFKVRNSRFSDTFNDIFVFSVTAIGKCT